ncbi:MAG TPA: hypothetical protein VGG20_20070 [Thermoanaerobaculia bacterium]|jgi:hypothetical protein
MAKQQTRYSDYLTEWEHLLNTLAANTADLPHLETSRVKLQGFLEDVRSLAMQQDLHAANKQLASKQLRATLSNGKKLTTFLRTGLKEHYGNRNDKLVEFGIPTFRRKKKDATDTPPPDGPTAGPAAGHVPSPAAAPAPKPAE